MERPFNPDNNDSPRRYLRVGYGHDFGNGIDVRCRDIRRDIDEASDMDGKITDHIHTSDPEVRWTNRRKMAWVALVSMLVITILTLFFVPESRLKILSDVITWFYFSMASVVGAYMGFTTYAAISRDRLRKF